MIESDVVAEGDESYFGVLDHQDFWDFLKI